MLRLADSCTDVTRNYVCVHIQLLSLRDYKQWKQKWSDTINIGNDFEEICMLHYHSKAETLKQISAFDQREEWPLNYCNYTSP